MTLYARQRVRWEAGQERFRVWGGINARTGTRSQFEIGSIIAVADRSRKFASGVPLLTNRTLFQRDRNLCLYCGEQFPVSGLTRDHIMPASRGGECVWENCVTACERCNHKKADRTPEEANMKLLAVPYTPNLAQYLILSNRRILADQMQFLLHFAAKKNRASSKLKS